MDTSTAQGVVQPVLGWVSAIHGKLRTSLFVGSLALIIPLTVLAAGQSLETRRAELSRLLADEWKYTLRTQPELATQVGDNRYNDRLTDYSDKAMADDLAHSCEPL